MDAEVSHKTLMAIIYCLLERTKQVSVNRLIFLYFTILSKENLFEVPGERAYSLGGGRGYFSSSRFLRVYVQYYTYGCA